MKISLWIEDGYEQIVLTPETETEKNILGGLHKGRKVEFMEGQFYHCQGGWLRQGGLDQYGIAGRDHPQDRRSTIIVMGPDKAA